ncbi:MAG: class I SAM-dependent methyltransferase [Chloroherpetonaceae bacterium]|nr:class I SAM-dependent methyltransferase [Chloroherpetonaceae bacterium]
MKLDPRKVEANIPCTICGERESHPFMDLNFKQFGYPGIFRLRQCKSCGLIFNSPRLRKEEFPKLYKKNYYFFNELASHEISRIKSQYLRSVALLNIDARQRKLIEIGSAKGYQLALLKALGWDVQGVELSNFAANFASKTFNVPVFRGTAELYARECTVKYDVAVAFDVIEHVLDPAQFVAAVAQLVKVGGILIIDTPNGNAKHIEVHRELWSGFIPFHIYFFNAENLTRLLRDHGFTVVKSFTYNNALVGYQERKKMLEPSLKERFYEAVGLRQQLANIKHIWLSRAETKEWLNEQIQKAAEEVRFLPTYFETSDAKLPLAKRQEGENLVIIAQKH